MTRDTEGDGLLRIGPFSRASWLSVKALRSYHESGLLVPAEVDPQTGYRSYAASQLLDAVAIRRMRDLDVPLDVIRAVLDARDPDVTRKLLAEHARTLDERLSALQRTVDELSKAVEAPSEHTPVHRRIEPARTVLALSATVTPEDWESFLAHARAVLTEAARAGDSVVADPFGACYPPPLDDVQDVVAIVPVTAPPHLSGSARAAGVRVDDLPHTEVAVLVHAGSTDDLEDSYRMLGAWVARNAAAADLPVREHYLVGPPDSDDPDEHRTEICWPVHPTARPETSGGSSWRP